MEFSKNNEFMTRLSPYDRKLRSLYYGLYEHTYHNELENHYKHLLEAIYTAYKSRSQEFLDLDKKGSSWYQDQDVVAMTLYMDLFSVDVEGFKKKIPYLKELGITLIHFMPLLSTREGDNDGGYAVKDYKNLQERFGSMGDFINLVSLLRENGIYTCIDFVLNHTAKEHEWAKKAFEGDVKYQNLYMMYDTDEIPRAYDRTVPEVFPGVSPGNFTYYEEIKKWVFTSFYEYQWDLNFKNPELFEKIVDILLYFGNIGINMVRLDAIPFMWKELGTTCRNLPQVHDLLKMFNIIGKIVCPSTVLLGEAIVEPQEIVGYYGKNEEECQLMYNATYMVNIWNAIATRDVRLLNIDLGRFHLPQWSCWINYIRCHDDIGWGFNEKAISDMGLSPFDHKQYLIHFYEGTFENTFSVGQLYEYHEETKDARNCGTLASLCGLETAVQANDVYQKELALKRIQMIDAMLLASSGIPLIYSGDEIATQNDYSYLEDTHKSHDSRWLHRPYFDWDRAELRKDFSTPEGIIFNRLKQLITLRKSLPIFKSDVPMRAIPLNNNHVFCFVKQFNGHDLVCLFNFSEDRQFIDAFPIRSTVGDNHKKDLISGREVSFNQHQFQVGPYEAFWFYA